MATHSSILCLGNPMDRGICGEGEGATVRGVKKESGTT